MAANSGIRTDAARREATGFSTSPSAVVRIYRNDDGDECNELLQAWGYGPAKLRLVAGGQGRTDSEITGTAYVLAALCFFGLACLLVYGF